MTDGDMSRPENLDADGNPLSGRQRVTVAPSGVAEVNYRKVKTSIGLRIASLPDVGVRAVFEGEATNELPGDCREIACFPFGASDNEPLPWFLPEALTHRQRSRIEHYRLSRQPLPPDLAAAVRTLDATNDPHPYVAFRDRKIWAHLAPVEGSASAAGVETLSDDETAALPPESRRCAGRRPVPTAAFTPKKRPDWWKIGRVALWLCAVAACVPFVQTLILLMVQLEELGEGSLYAFMVGRAGTGVPGLPHFASSVFWLGGTISLFAVVAGLLRVFQVRSEKPDDLADRKERLDRSPSASSLDRSGRRGVAPRDNAAPRDVLAEPTEINPADFGRTDSDPQRGHQRDEEQG